MVLLLGCDCRHYVPQSLCMGNLLARGHRALQHTAAGQENLENGIWSKGRYYYADRVYTRWIALPLAGQQAGGSGDILELGYMHFNADDPKMAGVSPQRFYFADPLRAAINQT